MKKRVLSMLLAFILCFSTLPMTAFAQETVQEADVVTEQADPAAEQEEQQAAAAPGEETPADKSTTAGEAPDTVKPSAESVSDNDVGTQDTVADDEKKAAVQKVQALIDALPETVTVENAESIGEQLEAIAEAMESLTEEQIAELDMEHLYAISEAMSAPMTVAEGEHRHPVCGETCTDGEVHEDVTWTPISELTNDMEAGNYYLTNDIILKYGPWVPKNDINLCLNGHTLTIAESTMSVIYGDISLCNCSSETKTVSCYEGIRITENREFKLYDNVRITSPDNNVVTLYRGKFIMYGGTISDCIFPAVDVDSGTTFEMKGGEIRNNSSSSSYYGGGVNVNGTFIVSGTAKVTGNTANGAASNVYLQSGAKMIVGDAGLKDGASIGVTLNKYPNDGGSVTIATGKIEGSSKYFSADAGDPYGVMEQDGALVLKNGVPHIHPVCGATCTDDDHHNSVEWTGITSLDQITGDGNYYLANDIVFNNLIAALTKHITGNVNLCLNGHEIMSYDHVLSVDESATLNLCNPHEEAVCSGVEVAGGGTFNLYGKVQITKSNDRGVEIADGGTFTMYGGTISNSSGGVAVRGKSTFIMNGGSISDNSKTYSSGGGGVYVEGTFIVNGGNISQNTANYGGGVYVSSNGNFTMKGGSISGNKSTYNGGGICALAKNSIIINGGSIFNNTAQQYGGGAYIGNDSTFTMTDSSIYGNEAEVGGGGVCATQNVSFTMRDSTITGNHSVGKGSGVLVYAYASLFSVSGSVKITDNTSGGTLTNGVYTDATPSNVELSNNANYRWASVTVEKSGLKEGSSIGISVNDDHIPVAMSEYVNVGTDQAGDSSQYFFADAGDPYRVTERKEGELVLVKGNLHEHPICGDTCEDGENHSDVTWRGIYSLDEIDGDGSYYLLDSLTLKHVWYCKYDVKLCLNGKTITGVDGDRVIRVVKEKSLDITDCQATPGKITHAAGATGAGILVYGTLTLWNGNITGNTTVHDVGAGVFVVWTGTFNMKGGMISGNKITSDTKHGAGVYVGLANGDAKDGIFNMSGGTITGNTSAGTGGGVSMLTGTFTMTGGTITGNNSTGDEETQSGGVYVTGQAVMNVSGDVQITDNWRNGTWNEQTKRYEQGDNGTASNVCLSGTENEAATITVNEGLKQEARIGVIKSAANLPTTGNTVKIATGATDNALDYTEIFTSDITDGDYKVVKNGTDLYLNAHQHSWVYKANGAVITAECSGCDAEGGSVTLTAPEKLVYDGNGKTAYMTFTDDWQGPAVVDAIPICYEKEDGTYFDGEPINVGTYVAKISINNKSGEPATASVKYTILKAPLTVTARNHKIWYGEEPANIGVTFSSFANDKDETALEFTPKYTYDYTQYGNVGEYKIIPQCPDGLNLDEKLPNYKVIFEPGTLTVEQKEVFLIWDNYENRIYGDESPIRVTIAGLVNNDEISAEIAGADLTAGTHTAEVTKLTGDKAGNYKLPANPTVTYKVARAKQTLEFITKVYNITYGSISFENEFTKTSNYNTDVFYESSDQKVVTVDENGHSRVVGVGTATITATAVENENYERVQATCTVNVTPKPVTISGVKANNKTYDGTDAAAFDLTDARIDGIVEKDVADDLKINVANAKAVFEDVNAGTDKTVSFTGFELTGQDAGNYTLSAQPANETADITPATITIIPETGKTKIYGAKDPELTYTYSGEISGEKPLFTGALGREAGENVGSYVINKGTLALMDNSNGKFSAGNYTLKVSNTPVNFVINRATPEIKVEEKTLVKNGNAVDISTWASFNNTDAGAKLTYKLVGAPAGISLTEDNLLKAENADTAAESFKIKVTADATANFTAPEEKQFTVQVVEKVDAGVKIDAPASKTYGDADFTLQASTVAADNGTWSWTSSNEAILKIVSGAETAAPVIHVVKADATGATLTATYISDAYYGTASVTIKVAPKTVTAAMIGEVESREYNGGAIMPTPEVKDGEAILTPGGDFEFGYSDNTNAGTATLTITGKGNYTGIAEKKFTIEPKNIESAIIVLGGLSRPYTGEEQTVEIVSVTLPDGDGVNLERDIDYTVKDNSNTATDAAKIVLTIEGKGNYTGIAEKTWEITRIEPKLADFDVVPDLSNELTYSGEEQIVNVTTKAGIRGMGMITVRYNGSTERPVNVGSYAITIDVADGSNYKAISGIEAGTLTIKKAAAPTLADVRVDHAYATTGNQTVSLAELVKSAKSYATGEITGNMETEILSDINVTGDGVLQYTLTGKGAAGSTVTIPVTITSTNYEETTVNVVITIKQATPTGAPDYDFIHDSSKTLKDAGLDLINSSLNPKEGTLEWIDSNGKVLPGETKLEEGRKYIWRFTPDDPNYAVITGEVELYAPYRILDGADSTWTQSTDGTIAIRGNGDFEKFQSVKVDGVVVDAKNYTVAKGSTIITFKEDYLKTLSTGSHTFELVWTDGSAATKFTIAAKPDNGDNNNSDNNNNDKNDDSDNDTVVIGNVSSGNNTVPAVIGAPKTGDASGIWMTLFAVSLAGLAAMLVRKKNNRE